jgi:hypothetical protein
VFTDTQAVTTTAAELVMMTGAIDLKCRETAETKVSSVRRTRTKPNESVARLANDHARS